VEVVVPIKGMRLVADLAAGPKGVELKDATFAGRIPLGTMFSRVGPASSCSDAGIYPALLPNVCAALDLPADPARDGKGDACSALSFAFHVDLVPANVAGSGTSQITPHVPACPPTTGNPCAPP
jgi:hypothetical protein